MANRRCSQLSSAAHGRSNTEISPGTYVAKEPDGRVCYWSRLSAFTGEPEDYTVSEQSVGQSVTMIQSHDVGFYSDGCGIWTLTTTESPVLTAEFPGSFENGIYIVNQDIGPGTYIADAIENRIASGTGSRIRRRWLQSDQRLS